MTDKKLVLELSKFVKEKFENTLIKNKWIKLTDKIQVFTDFKDYYSFYLDGDTITISSISMTVYLMRKENFRNFDLEGFLEIYKKEILKADLQYLKKEKDKRISEIEEELKSLKD